MAAPSGTGRPPVMKSFWMSTKRRAVFIFYACVWGLGKWKIGGESSCPSRFSKLWSAWRYIAWLGHPIFCPKRLLTEVIRPLFYFGGAYTPPRPYIFEGEKHCHGPRSALYFEKTHWNEVHIAIYLEKWNWNGIRIATYSEKWFWNWIRIAIYFEIWYKISHIYLYISRKDTEMRFGWMYISRSDTEMSFGYLYISRYGTK